MEKIKMKYYEEEFEVSGYPKAVFRFKQVKGIQLFALKITQWESSKNLYDFNVFYTDFVLSNTEVRLGEKWVSVKDKDSYLPTGIEEDGTSIMEIVSRFNTEVLNPFFLKSSESH